MDRDWLYSFSGRSFRVTLQKNAVCIFVIKRERFGPLCHSLLLTFFSSQSNGITSLRIGIVKKKGEVFMFYVDGFLARIRMTTTTATITITTATAAIM